jgi:NAD+ synthase (glutamine-hydrolysing)
MSFITVAAATLPSVPLDFTGNRDRILESIKLAKDKGARLRTGPELEVPGYGCLDHHLEGDTFLHSWVPLTYSFPQQLFLLFGEYTNPFTGSAL